MRNLLCSLRRLLAEHQERAKQPHWLNIQLVLARLVVALTLCVVAGVVSGWLGANSIERPAVALAGLVYGFVGTPYLFGFIIGAAWRTRRPRLRTGLLALAVALLSGPTIGGSVYMAVHSPPDAPWHFRLTILAAGIALSVAGFRELMGHEVHSREAVERDGGRDSSRTIADPPSQSAEGSGAP